MDQNEKIGFGGVKVLQALDSKWRCPIYYEVVTSLRGLDHSLFFLGAVRHWKLVPYNVIVDGAPAWCGVREMMKIWWHDCLEPVLVPHDDGDMLVERDRLERPVRRAFRPVLRDRRMAMSRV